MYLRQQCLLTVKLSDIFNEELAGCKQLANFDVSYEIYCDIF